MEDPIWYKKKESLIPIVTIFATFHELVGWGNEWHPTWQKERQQEMVCFQKEICLPSWWSSLPKHGIWLWSSHWIYRLWESLARVALLWALSKGLILSANLMEVQRTEGHISDIAMDAISKTLQRKREMEGTNTKRDLATSIHWMDLICVLIQTNSKTTWGIWTWLNSLLH